MRRRILVLLVVALGSAMMPVRAAAAPGLPDESSWPLAGAIRVLREFDPPAERWGRGHRGVDLAARPGDPVLAAAAGRVSFAASLAGRGVLVVDHGAVRTTYEPVRAIVAVGTRVSAGSVIGVVGTGSHCRSCLHWGLRAGDRYLDPLLLGERVTGIRLVPGAQRAVAERRAAERADEAERAADMAGEVASVDGFVGSVGREGFGRPVPGSVTSAFGMRLHPVLGVWKLHDGTDFGAGCGTPIRAPAAGVVTRRFFNGGYGHRLMLDHGRAGGRRVVTGYNHATRYVVGPGARVAKGQVIGYVGSTGYSTGCHLHLMVWLDGRLTNPMTVF